MRKFFLFMAFFGIFAGGAALAHPPTSVTDGQSCLSQSSVSSGVVARDIRVNQSAADAKTGDVTVTVSLCAASQQTQLGSVGFNFAPITKTLHTLASNGQGFGNPYAQNAAPHGQAALGILLASSVTVAKADVPDLDGAVLINLFWNDCVTPTAPNPCTISAVHTVMFVANGA